MTPARHDTAANAALGPGNLRETERAAMLRRRARDVCLALALSLALPPHVPATAVSAQEVTGTAVRISMGPDLALSPESDPRPVVESHMAASPSDPRHLLVTAMVTELELPPPGQGLSDESLCHTWTSRDGGDSWIAVELPLEGCADPWVAITGDGTALFAGLGNDGGFVFRSPDGGAAWEVGPAGIGSGHDHVTMFADNSSSGGRSRVYLASGRGVRNPEGRRRMSVYLARSDDDGRSFPTSSDVIVSNLNYEALNPVTLSDGTLIVPLTDHSTRDGRRIEIGARRTWALRSHDGGRTFTEPLFITDACDGRGGWPSMAVGSGDVLWFTCIAKDYASVVLLRSEDTGESWTHLPDLAADVPDAHVLVPSIATAGSHIAVTWQDRRDDPDRECQRLYFSASLDGGETFLPTTPVSEALSCPDQPGNGWTAQRYRGGGDYAGLAATGPSTWYATWSDARTGVFGLRGRRIEVGN